MNKKIVLFAVAIIMVSCGHRYHNKVDDIEKPQQDTVALGKLQGIWVDNDTEEPLFRVNKDSIYYPDSTNLPQHISIVADTFFVGPNAYIIENLGDNFFSFHSMTILPILPPDVVVIIPELLFLDLS